MTDIELLRAVFDYQSFKSAGDTYNGLDEWSVGNIQDDRIYALVITKQMDALERNLPTEQWDGVPSIKFFFDQATYDNFVAKDGSYDTKALNEALQIEPYYHKAEGIADYRVNIACFDRNGEIRMPIAICEANTQFGGGGAHQVFIPEEEFNALLQDGTLKYNAEASNINKGYNKDISLEEYADMQSNSNKRCINCEKKEIPHPEPEACQSSFENNPIIEGVPFNATEVKRYNEELDNKEPFHEDKIEQDQKEGLPEREGGTKEAAYGNAEIDNHASNKVEEIRSDEMPAEDNAEQEKRANEYKDEDAFLDDNEKQDVDANNLTEGSDGVPDEEKLKQAERACDLTEGTDELPAEESSEKEEQASDLIEGTDELPAEESSEKEEQASDLIEGTDELPTEESSEKEEQVNDLTEGAGESPTEESGKQEATTSEVNATEKTTSEEESSEDNQSYRY